MSGNNNGNGRSSNGNGRSSNGNGRSNNGHGRNNDGRTGGGEAAGGALTVHEEALVDQALDRLLGDATVEDLTAQILAAWREEQPEEQETSPLPSARVGGSRASRRSRRRTSRRGMERGKTTPRLRVPRRDGARTEPVAHRRLLVAAVVLLGIGLVFSTAWLTGIFGPEIVATADAPVWVVQHAGDAGRRTTDIRRGDLVLVLPDENRRLTLPDGARIDVASYSLLRFPSQEQEQEPDQGQPRQQGQPPLQPLQPLQPLPPHLLRGTTTMTAGSEPFTFSTSQGAVVEAQPGSRVLAEVSLPSDPTNQPPTQPPNQPSTQPRDPDMFLQRARTLITTARLPEAVLALTLLSGQALAQTQGGRMQGQPGLKKKQKLELNKKVVLDGRGDQVVGPPLTKAEKKMLDESLKNIQFSTALLDSSDSEAAFKVKNAQEAEGDMLSLSRTKPRAMFEYIRDRMLKIHTAAKEFDVRMRLLWVMVRDTDPRTTAVVLGRLTKEARKFDVDQLMVLSERGIQPASVELERRIKEQLRAPRGLRQGASPDYGMLLYAAAHLALKNNDAGKAMLQSKLAARGRISIWDEHLAAAVGLHRLGDKGAWARVIEMAANEVMQDMRKQNQKRVQWLLERVEYFHQGVGGKKLIAMPKRTNPVDAYVAKKKVDAGDMTAVMKRLDELMMVK